MAKKDHGMHTTVDDNPRRVDNPPPLHYFPLFSLPEDLVSQMTISGINRVFHSTKTSTAAPEFALRVLVTYGLSKTKYLKTTEIFLLENPAAHHLDFRTEFILIQATK